MNKIILSGFFLLCTYLSFSQDTLSIDEKGIFVKVEKEADYHGGMNSWIDFLQKNLNPNVPVDNGAPVGSYTVYIQFIVEKDGTLNEFKPLTRLGYGMETEVVQLLKKSGKWDPAMQDGKPVRAYRKQPVTFRVTQDNLTIITETPYVLYSGINNEIEIAVDRTKNEELNVTITKGTISKSANGTYIAKVKGTGRALMSITGKKGKSVADVSFEIRDKQ